MALATPENAPATRKIMHIIMVPSSPAARQNLETFSVRGMYRFIRNAATMPTRMAAWRGNWFQGCSTVPVMV